MPSAAAPVARDVAESLEERFRRGRCRCPRKSRSRPALPAEYDQTPVPDLGELDHHDHARPRASDQPPVAMTQPIPVPTTTPGGMPAAMVVDQSPTSPGDLPTRRMILGPHREAVDVGTIDPGASTGTRHRRRHAAVGSGERHGFRSERGRIEVGVEEVGEGPHLGASTVGLRRTGGGGRIDAATRRWDGSAPRAMPRRRCSHPELQDSLNGFGRDSHADGPEMTCRLTLPVLS